MCFAILIFYASENKKNQIICIAFNVGVFLSSRLLLPFVLILKLKSSCDNVKIKCKSKCSDSVERKTL